MSRHAGTVRCGADNNNCGRGYPSGRGGGRDGKSGGSEEHSVTVAVGGGVAVDNYFCQPIKASDQELAKGAPPYHYRLIREGPFELNVLISQYNALSKRYFDGSKGEHFLLDHAILQQLVAIEKAIIQKCDCYENMFNGCGPD